MILGQIRNNKNYMKIRYFDKLDANHVSEFFSNIVCDLSYYNDLARENEIRRYSGENLIVKANEDPQSIIIAEENENIIGICFNRFDDYTIWLEWIITTTTERKKGIGKALIMELEKSAIDRKCHKIWCDSRTSNELSQRFLISMGFDLITTIENHWYKQDFVLLQKLINA